METPCPPYRHAIAVIAGESESYLWPQAMPTPRRAEVAQSEIVRVYPHRSSGPAHLWDSLLERATVYVDILVYVGMLMTEKLDLLKWLKEKGENCARARLLFGDRHAPEVTRRTLDEGIGEHTIAAKIEHTLAFFGPLDGTPGVGIRTHGAALYNSIYRFDDQMIVNQHVYGKVASAPPPCTCGDYPRATCSLPTKIKDSFTAVWEAAAR